jgi:hypothetical protein
MKFPDLFFIGYRTFFQNISVFITLCFYIIILCYLLFFFSIEPKIQMDLEDILSIQAGDDLTETVNHFKHDVIILIISFIFLSLLNCYVTFVCFEKDSYNFISKILGFTKFYLCHSYRLIPIFFGKILMMFWITSLPIIALLLINHSLDTMFVSQTSSKAIIDLLTIPISLIGIYFFCIFYLRLCLVEYAALIQKIGFWRSYEISMTAMFNNKLKIITILIINCIISVALIFIILAGLGIPIELKNGILTLISNNSVILLLGFFIYTIPLLAHFISCCQLFKYFAYRNDTVSAERVWNQLF